MRTHVLALLAALLLLMAIGAGTAAAQAPTQVAGQESGSQQSADSEANATQVAPSNRNVDVRIFSPGNSGAVDQTNAAGAASAAGNANSTDQSASQAQPGAGTQAVGQSASNDQDANAEANAVQVKPSNDNVVVRIDSPGSDGPVTQTNAAGALAAAGNDNSTSQTADQQQGGSGCCKGGGGTQVADQKAHNDQSADATANAEQIKPSNKNVNVRIGSPGNNGSVTQTNAALAGALAGNSNATTQTADQSQDGGCKCGGGGTQVADQKAKSEQSADADANAKQIHPSNNNTSVRIDSPGNDGPVTQTNLALAGALAGNENSTDQTADQSQGGGGGTQVAGQHAYNDQYADADANAVQIKPSNDNTAVRIGSPGSSGSVTQTNAALAGALAGNSNETTQSADQSQAGDSCKCHGGGLQVAEQKAGSKQDADAEANAFQFKPSNSNTAVDVGGHKKKCGCPDDYKSSGGGDVTQTNAALAAAIGVNLNETTQSADQSGGAGGVQAIEQKAASKQYADADANAFQFKPSNSNTAVDLGGHKKKCGCPDDYKSGGGGDVEQTNLAAALGIALNANSTDQTATQSAAGDSCKCYGGGTQAAYQKAYNDQDADADANAFQLGASNSNTPVSLWGAGGSGSVRQLNAALALALAANLNRTDQEVTQEA